MIRSTNSRANAIKHHEISDPGIPGRYYGPSDRNFDQSKRAQSSGGNIFSSSQEYPLPTDDIGTSKTPTLNNADSYSEKLRVNMF